MSESVENAIVEHILGAVADHRLKAGTKLGEQALSDIFSSNRANVRRALLTLAAQKVVELRPNRGAFVATPTPKEARNVFQARRAIEKTIVRNVVALASQRDCSRLRRHTEMEREVRSSSNRDAIRLSGDFHLLLAEMGQNDVLAEFLKELVLRSSLIIGLYSSPAASVCESDGHDQIIAAIAAGDEAAAVEVIDAHLRHLEAGLDFAEEQEVQDLRAILAGGLKPSRRARSLRVSG